MVDEDINEVKIYSLKVLIAYNDLNYFISKRPWSVWAAMIK